MKKIAIFLVIISVFIIGCGTEDKAGIDFSCNSDSDCVIKDVGNMCGGYPLCVNQDFKPNPPELDSNVCGWPSINYCECKENECVSGFDQDLD